MQKVIDALRVFEQAERFLVSPQEYLPLDATKKNATPYILRVKSEVSGAGWWAPLNKAKPNRAGNGTALGAYSNHARQASQGYAQSERKIPPTVGQ
jgi:hypothetical protein